MMNKKNFANTLNLDSEKQKIIFANIKMLLLLFINCEIILYYSVIKQQ